MRILLPVHHFPPRHSAGAELYTMRLAQWLSRHGHQVRVVCFDAVDRGSPHSLDERIDDADGVFVHRLQMDLLRSPQRRLWTFDNHLLGGWFERALESWRPDIVHFQAGYLIGAAPLRVAARAGVPSLLTLHDYWFLCPRHTLLRGDGSLCERIPDDPVECAWCHHHMWSDRDRRMEALSSGMYGALVRRLMPRAERELAQVRRATMCEVLRLPRRVIAPSKYLAQRMETLVDRERLYVLPLGIDPTPFVAQRSSPRTLHGALRFGFVGQIRPHKGCALLLDAFSQLRGGAHAAELHVYGAVPQDAYGEQVRRVASSDARIHLHGAFANADAAAVFASIDVLVVPSTWYENLPLSILEAYAAGIPVVASDAGGMAELVHHDVDGLTFRLGDADSLRDRLQRLCDDAGLYRRLQAQAAHRPASDIEDEMRTLFTWYEEGATVS